MYPNGAALFMEEVTTSRHPQMIHRAQDPALPVFCGVDPSPTAGNTFVPLAALGGHLISVASPTGFGWFVRWISSVVILDLPTPAHVFVVP